MNAGPDPVRLSLPRAWWFPALPGLRVRGGQATYQRFDLDEQPKVLGADPEGLGWMSGLAEHSDWAIDELEDGYQVRALTVANLSELLPGPVEPPDSLRLLAERPELQRRIRSVTGCYLDLGDRTVPTSNPAGVLLHVLSDSQWVRHWFVYLDDRGTERVLTSPEPIGFDLPDDWEAPPADSIALDGSWELEICADSVNEFLYRLWVENEIWWALRNGAALQGRLAGYAAQLGSV